MSKKRRDFEQLYEAYREILEDRLMNIHPSYTKGEVKQLVSDMFSQYRKISKSNEAAFRKILHREEFIGKEMRGAENLIAAIKEQGGYKDFRREVQGWNKKLDLSAIKWNELKGAYEYNGWFIYQSTTALGSPEWRWTK